VPVLSVPVLAAPGSAPGASRGSSAASSGRNTIGGSGPALKGARAARSSWPAWPAAAASRAVTTSQRSATAPAKAPKIVGTAYEPVASCLVSAAARPMPAKIANPRNPRASRRIASTPTAMEYRNTTTSTPPRSTVLSPVPNVEVAHSFTASGVRSIAASPTAMTGDAAGTVNPAKSCPIPIAAAAATSPHTAPHHRGNLVLEVMPVWSVAIRQRYGKPLIAALPNYTATLPARFNAHPSGLLAICLPTRIYQKISIQCPISAATQ
jgi:hypothetical protein